MREVQAALPSLGGEQGCVDGKTLRGSRVGEKPVPLMSAYAAKARLAQRAVDDKSHEIKAIPDLWAMLDWEGAGVSVDAMGCQKTLARQSIEAGADYELALQDHPPQLSEEVR
jgi:hypothetical protein